jgi:hypothetical protein
VAAYGFFAWPDDEVRSFYQECKTAVRQRKTLVSWNSGDSSATKAIEYRLADVMPVISNEMLRRFPAEMGRRPITRTTVCFS